MEYEKLNKKAIKCMFLGTLVQFTIVTAILFAVWWNFKNILPTVVQGVMLGLFVVDLVYLLVSPKIRYEKYRYCITNDRIDVKQGPVSKKLGLNHGEIYILAGNLLNDKEIDYYDEQIFDDLVDKI